MIARYDMGRLLLPDTFTEAMIIRSTIFIEKLSALLFYLLPDFRLFDSKEFIYSRLLRNALNSINALIIQISHVLGERDRVSESALT